MRWSQQSLVVVSIAALLGVPGMALAEDEGRTNLDFLPTDDPFVSEVISLPHEQKGDPEDLRRYRALAGTRADYSRLAAGPGGEIWVYDRSCGRVPEDCVYEAGEDMVCRVPPKGIKQPRMDSCVWQAGVKGRHKAPFGIRDMAVTPDGHLWAISDKGLASFDGQDWTNHWRARTFGGGLTGLAVAPDGSVIAVGQLADLDWEDPEDHEGPLFTAEIVLVRVDGDRLEVEHLGSPPTGGQWSLTPGAVTVTPDGAVWMGGISPRSGADTFAEEASVWVGDPSYATRGFLIHYDGTTARVVESQDAAPTQPGVSALAVDPDGSLWALLWRASSEGLPEPLLARYDGQAWGFTAIDEDLPGRPADSMAVDSAGTVWLTFGLGSDTSGVAAFDGDTWTTYLPGSRPWEMVVGPDDSVWWTGASIVPEFGKEDRSTVGLHTIRPDDAAASSTS